MRQTQFIIFVLFSFGTFVISYLTKNYFGSQLQGIYLNCLIPELKAVVSVVVLFLLVRKFVFGTSIYGTLCVGLVCGAGLFHILNWVTVGCVTDYLTFGGLWFDIPDVLIVLGLGGLGYLLFAEKLK